MRLLVGEPEYPNEAVETLIWDRAYVLENGKTVEAIRGHRKPTGTTVAVDSEKPFPDHSKAASFPPPVSSMRREAQG